MKSLIAGAAVLAALVTSAVAEDRYDRKLEQAMRDIAAAKMGVIRGSIDHGRRLEYVIAQDMVTTGSIHRPLSTKEPRHGRGEAIKLAVERKVSRIVF